MRNTFRIPWVWRVKVVVLRLFWVMPVFCLFMMWQTFEAGLLGTYTTFAAVLAFMTHFGACAVVRFIDPEDWQDYESTIRSKKVTD